MIVPLVNAVADTCGGKAGALGALLRAGLPVPDGVVLPFATYRAASPDASRDPDLDAGVIEALRRALDELGNPPVAVRSSAAHEDTGQASAAGQHESVLGVIGVGAVADAVRTCWASLFSARAAAYRAASGAGDPRSGDPAMAVVVQRHIDAEVSGVMFTPTDLNAVTEIEASWGLGPSVVGGEVTPDAYHVTGDGAVTRTLADKRIRLDRRGTQLVSGTVSAAARRSPTLDDANAAALARSGADIAAVLGGPQDVEWAIADGRLWILQARPVTAVPPAAPVRSGTPPPATDAITGLPGSHGTATGVARIVRGPGDFARVRPGDILVCPFTDPAWTPLLGVAAGVVTETGGVLSHAAIVARERGIPAVLGVSNATRRLRDGAVVVIDGTAGVVTPATAYP